MPAVATSARGVVVVAAAGEDCYRESQHLRQLNFEPARVNGTWLFQDA